MSTTLAAQPSFDVRAARVAAAAGLLGVAGNVLAVAILHGTPAAYRLARLDEWASAVSQQRAATTASAVAFVVGLLALAYWAQELPRATDSACARAGAWLISVTALFDGAGTVTPLVLANHVPSSGPEALAVGRALLGMSLSLDAVFNFGLGVGLVLASVGHRGALRVAMAVAGLANLPVAAQAVWDPAANFLYASAPLWLGVMVWTSVSALRQARVP